MKLRLSGLHPVRNTIVRVADTSDFSLIGYHSVLFADSATAPVVYLPSEKNAVFQLPENHAVETVCEFQPQPLGRTPFAVTEKSQSLQLSCYGAPVFDYCFSPDYPKPFWGPLYTPNGKIVTRDIYPEGAEDIDHPWQRGLFTGHGDINGWECWNEPAGTDYGRCIQQDMKYEITPVFFALQTQNTWLSPQNKPLLDEARTIRVFGTYDAWILDWTSIFQANHGTCTIGSTKEAGFLAIRLNPQMQGDHTGHITNAYGAATERECWSRHAQWVDYSGRVDGAEVGVAIFDHPQNLRHPASWHVRDYGLFAHNIWLTDPNPHILDAGAVLTMKYRLVIHNGDAVAADIKARYLNYENQPVIERIEPLKS